MDMGTDPHQVLADTFTLFRSGPADYFYHVRLPPPCFESHLNGVWYSTYFYKALGYSNVIEHSRCQLNTRPMFHLS